MAKWMRGVMVVALVAMAAPAGAAAGGLPDGVPPAALAPEPELPAPAGWPFRDAFPRTSGTSRLVAGSLQWSDFLYDDRGAKQMDGTPFSFPQSWPATGLAPSAGGYTYPTGASGNGADIFRVGIGLDERATYWRVDWTTLADPAVPAAAFVMDTDDDARTGVAAWPAGANVRSAGLERALVVTSRGARLINLAGGGETQLPVEVDGRSFVVEVDRALLPVDGAWRVRVGAGLASSSTSAIGFRRPSGSTQTSDPWLYNVGFRDHRQEASEPYSFWMEGAQASALRAGDVSEFSTLVKWSDLAAGTTQPEPRPTGYTNRWYVSSQKLGEGVATEPPGYGDVQANFLGRVQPYAVYVPTDLDARPGPRPLTWILHSLGVNHNQYGATAPKLLQQACEQRGSICATTLGRGADGWYHDAAELDFWEVWARLADDYELDPERTVLSGYSMGGYGTYRLGLAYPDLFAKAVAIAAPMMCGVRLYGELAGSPGRSTHCTEDGDTGPLVPNAKWLPFYIGHGTNDELVPVTSVREHVSRFDAAGLRYRFELFAGEDHMVWSLQDGFSAVVKQMGAPVRERDPGAFAYSFFGDLLNEAWGFGPTGAYWVDDLRARNAAPGVLAHMEAASAARPHPAITPVDGLPSAVVSTDSTPALVEEQTWTLGATPQRRPEITLALRNVKAATVDAAAAGLGSDEDARAVVTTDGATALTLRELAPGARVSRGDELLGVADPAGRVTVPLAAGTHALTIAPRRPTALALTVPATARHTDAFEVSARLEAGGEPVAGAPVRFSGGGSDATAVTGADGVARATLTAAAAPGVHAVTVRFGGDDRRLASEASAAIELLPELTRMAYAGATSVRGDLVTLAASLAEDDGPVLGGRTVTFTVGGRTASATTGADGVARATMLIADHGRTQVVTARFGGGGEFTGSETAATLRWGG